MPKMRGSVKTLIVKDGDKYKKNELVSFRLDDKSS